MKSRTLAWGCMLLGGGLTTAGLLRQSDRTAHATELAASNSAARTVLPLGDHDFGRIVGSTKREQDLRLRNPGPATWHVAKTWQDCGCVAIVSSSENDVPPGEDLVVRVRIDTDGQPIGHIEKAFHVLLDPGAVQYTGHAFAECLPAPHAVPGVIDTTIARDDGAFVAQCELLVPLLSEGENVQVEVVDPPDGVQIEVAETSVTPPTRNYLVQVSGVMPEDRNLLVCAAFVQVRGIEGLEVDQQVVKIPCYVRRKSAIVPSPGVVFLRGDAPAREAQLFVKSDTGEPVSNLTWVDEPHGAMDFSYESATGRMHIVARENSAENVVLTLTAPSGDRAVVPIQLERGSGH